MSAGGHLVANRVSAGVPRLQRLRNAACPNVGRSTCTKRHRVDVPCMPNETVVTVPGGDA